jgi:hypothetical protein
MLVFTDNKRGCATGKHAIAHALIVVVWQFRKQDSRGPDQEKLDEMVLFFCFSRNNVESKNTQGHFSTSVVTFKEKIDLSPLFKPLRRPKSLIYQK